MKKRNPMIAAAAILVVLGALLIVFRFGAGKNDTANLIPPPRENSPTFVQEPTDQPGRGEAPPMLQARKHTAASAK